MVTPQTPKKDGYLVITSFSFPTTDECLALIFEPCAPSPQERLKTMKKCKEGGILVGVIFMPLLPFFSDFKEHLEEMIRNAKIVGLIL